MNSLRRKPEVILVPDEWAAEMWRNVRRSMRNDADIIQRWRRRQERQRIQQERQRIERKVTGNGLVRNQRKI